MSDTTPRPQQHQQPEPSEQQLFDVTFCSDDFDDDDEDFDESFVFQAASGPLERDMHSTSPQYEDELAVAPVAAVPGGGQLALEDTLLIQETLNRYKQYQREKRRQADVKAEARGDGYAQWTPPPPPEPPRSLSLDPSQDPLRNAFQYTPPQDAAVKLESLEPPCALVPREVPAARRSRQSSPDLDEFYTEFSRLLISSQHPAATAAVAAPSAVAPPSPYTNTCIVLSPASYEHIFARHWAPAAVKAAVVERPHRLLASAIGIGAALSLHTQSLPPAPAVPPPQPPVTLLSSRRRVDLTASPHVAAVHGADWARTVYALCRDAPAQLAQGRLEVPESWPGGDIYLGAGTVAALEGVVGAVETAVDTLYSTDDGSAVDKAFVAIRPPGHHSHACAPSGFCLINNAHIAIQYAAEHYGVSHSVIVDFDLHHGDGTQDICWKLAPFARAGAEDKATGNAVKLGYFSLHDINSFPTELGYATREAVRDASACVMAHDVCVWNVHLEKYDGDEAAFLALYETKYRQVVDKARQYLAMSRRRHFADERRRVAAALHGARKRRTLAEGEATAAAGPAADAPAVRPFRPLVAVSAGFDASENETVAMRRHGVYVPTVFYHRITEDIVRLAQEYPESTTDAEYSRVQEEEDERQAAGGAGSHGARSRQLYRTGHAKVLSLLEGGYSDGALSTGIFAHVSGLVGTRQAQQEYNTGAALDPLLLFNPFVAYHFEHACKPGWTREVTLRSPPPVKRGQAAAAAAAWARAAGSAAVGSVVEWLQGGIPLGRSLWPPGMAVRLNSAPEGVSAEAGDSPSSPGRRVLRDRGKVQYY